MESRNGPKGCELRNHFLDPLPYIDIPTNRRGVRGVLDFHHISFFLPRLQFPISNFSPATAHSAGPTQKVHPKVFLGGSYFGPPPGTLPGSILDPFWDPGRALKSILKRLHDPHMPFSKTTPFSSQGLILTPEPPPRGSTWRQERC